jgi:hypothetical protein
MLEMPFYFNRCPPLEANGDKRYAHTQLLLFVLAADSMV